MTQVSRYGHMLKVGIRAMRMQVRARYRAEGSVLNDTIMASMAGAETTLEIDSPDSSERVATVVRNAERGCFVMQALLQPVLITGQTLLNGQPLEVRQGEPGEARATDRMPTDGDTPGPTKGDPS